MHADVPVVNFNRPPRTPTPQLPDLQVDIPPPPQTPPPPEQSLLIILLPTIGIGLITAFYFLRSIDSGSGVLSALPLLALLVLTVGSTLWAQSRRRREYRVRQAEAHIGYRRLLGRKQARLQAANDAYRAILESDFPAPAAISTIVMTRADPLWQRRPIDPDFLMLRIGMGRIASPVTINLPDPDAVSAQFDFAFLHDYHFLEAAPVITSLKARWALGVAGTRAARLNWSRAAIQHLAALHAPQELHIHLLARQTAYEEWRWLEWLPHTSQSHRGGSADLMAFDDENIRNLLTNFNQFIEERRDKNIQLPHLLILMDDEHSPECDALTALILREGARVGASLITLGANLNTLSGDCNAVIELLPDHQFRYFETGADRHEITGMVDGLALPDAEQSARAQASLVAQENVSSGRIPRHVDFLDLYGVRQVEGLYAQINAQWGQVSHGGVLPHAVPIGRDSSTRIIELDLAENRHGPHGIIAGTTGAGKSEFLQTLICSLVLKHDPRLLNLLLIDFKGGSTFNVFVRLPHTVGMITNLDGLLIERALEALKSEMRVRQEFLKRMKVRDIAQYHRFFTHTPAHMTDALYHPLPHLFIIVDEFAQLAKEMPEFLRELVRIAQVGRSLGLHLILGTQTTEVVTEEMNANLQFKVCFRVQHIEASRAILRSPDAAYLPIGWAGRAYFQVGERGVFKQFQTAYAGGEIIDQARDSFVNDEPPLLEVLTDSGAVIDLLAQTRVAVPSAPPSILTDEPYSTARAVVDVVIDYAQSHQVPFMPPLLLLPLEERSTLRVIFRQAGISGWNGRAWQANAVLGAPIGLVDNIYERSQTPLWIYLKAAGQDQLKDGHVLITGASGSGKTMLVRTLAVSLACLHAPDALHLYIISFMSGALNDLGALPHAEQVIHGMETERVRRLLRRLIQTLNERQSGRAENVPAVVVLIDQYEPFRDAYYGHFAADFDRLVNEGHAAGIYLVLTASSISAVPERLRSLIQQRIALQQNTPSDYAATVGALPMQIDGALPKGRGFIHSTPPLMCQICLPCEYPTDDLPAALDAMRDLIGEMRAAYVKATGQEQSPIPIQRLPALIPFDSLPSLEQAGHIVTALGWCDDDALSAFALDWREHGPHFVAIGPPRSGKTNLLRAAVISAAREHPPDRLRFLFIDFTQRNLSALAALKHTAAVITTPAALENALRALEADARRAPLANDPTTVIVIDDYDFFSDAMSSYSVLLRQFRDFVKLRSGSALHVWAAGYFEHAGDPLIKYLLLRRCGFGLIVRESLQAIHLRITQLPADAMPEGRAFFVRHNSVIVVQTALVTEPETLVNAINARWIDHPQAALDLPLVPDAADTRSRPTGDLEIDTAGLIEDLLGRADDERTA